MSSSHLSPTSTSSEDTSDHTLSRRKPRVSAEHTLNRVRENQRRHRARQKDHVASLESKLAETEKQLVEARAEIEVLRAERLNGLSEPEICRHDIAAVSEPEICRHDIAAVSEQLVSISGTDTTDVDATSNQQPAINQGSTAFAYLETSNITYLSNPVSPGFIVELDTLSSPTTQDSSSSSVPLPLPSPSQTSLIPSGPPPCCTDIIPPVITSPTDPECSTCKTRPPPSPSESTTLCAQAFILISQQNFRNLDPGTIRMWLAQGLRRAQREGEGCRVENGALMRLLDYISGI